MKFRVISTALVTLLITSCATTKNYEIILNRWVGKNINDLISSFGYPRGSFTIPNGNKVYVYSFSRSMRMPTSTTSSYDLYGNSIYGTSTTTGGQVLTAWCRTYFETNKKNIIIKWRWEGNDCVAYKK